MSFLKKYKTDKVAETEGTWVSIDDDIEIKVARLNNKEASDMRAKLQKKYKNFTSIPDKVNEQILIKVISNTVLKDWKGIQDEKGVVAFSASAAEKMLTEYPDFLSDVISASAARETFLSEGTEASKNG